MVELSLWLGDEMTTGLSVGGEGVACLKTGLDDPTLGGGRGWSAWRINSKIMLRDQLNLA